MIDLKATLENPDNISQKLKTRGYSLNIKFIEERSELRKQLIQEKEDLASEKNKLSDSFKSVTDDSEKKELMNNSKSIDEKIQNLKLSLEEVEDSLNSYLLEVPNIPYDNCPIGDNENDNRLIERFGDINTSNSQEHSDILAQLNMLSFEDAVKITQSRFVVLKGKIASLHRALVNFMLNIQSGNGYTEYNVPYICNANSLTGTGQLPKFEEDLFKISNSNLYLIPTAEVPLTNIYRDKIFSLEELPVLMTAHTPCFRSEAGSYGLDTKGMIRQHQFEKIELVQIVHPSHSEQALDQITNHAKSILDLLEITLSSC